jgi:hypothetical protein
MRTGEGGHTEADGARSIQRRMRQGLERPNLARVVDEEVGDPVQLHERLHAPERKGHVCVRRERVLVLCAPSTPLSSLKSRIHAHRSRDCTPSLKREDCEERAAVVEEEHDRGEHACADQGVSRDAPQRHRDVLGGVARQHWRVQGDDIHAYDCSGVRSDCEAEACHGVDEERTKRFGLRRASLRRRARLSGANPNETLRLYAHTMSAGMLAGAADGAREGRAARGRARPSPLQLDGALLGQALLNSRLKRVGATARTTCLFHPAGLRHYSCRAAIMQHDPHEDADGRALMVPGAVRELLLKREERLHAQDPHGRSSVRGEQGLMAQIEAQLNRCLPLVRCVCLHVARYIRDSLIRLLQETPGHLLDCVRQLSHSPLHVGA